jgi:uncharacterized protein (TIGR00255 family)
MIRSMTGYGEASAELEGVRVKIELRSFNHRFADLRLRLPPGLAEHEATIRRRVLERVRRGRVDVSVLLAPLDTSVGRPQLNRALLDEALKTWTLLREDWGVTGDPGPALLSIPGMFARAEALEPAWTEAQRGVVDEVLSAALAQHDDERLREGRHLQEEMVARLRGMLRSAEAIQTLTAEQPARTRDRLIERLRALAPEIQLDPARMAQEAALLADRLDVTEELVRLAGHLAQALRLVEQPDGEPVGKRLEFLLQEIGRETNTIQSKTADLTVCREALQLKAEAEKVREQIQNLE